MEPDGMMKIKFQIERTEEREYRDSKGLHRTLWVFGTRKADLSRGWHFCREL